MSASSFPMHRHPYPVLLALLAALLLAAAPVRAELERPRDFAMADLDGQVHRLSDYRGRWVILNFWATWCPPCLEEIPDLIAYQDAHPEQVVLGINFEQIEPAALRAFVAEQGMDFPVLPVGEHVLADLEPIRGLPTTIIITPAGELIARHTGPVTRQMLEDFIGAEQAALDAAARAGN